LLKTTVIGQARVVAVLAVLGNHFASLGRAIHSFNNCYNINTWDMQNILLHYKHLLKTAVIGRARAVAVLAVLGNHSASLGRAIPCLSDHYNINTWQM
jgi:hypothetical protein